MVQDCRLKVLCLAVMLTVAVLPACSTVKPEAFKLGNEAAAPIGWFEYCQRVGVKDKDC
jgi:predicted transglutaminase-like cysteine proteinase